MKKQLQRDGFIVLRSVVDTTLVEAARQRLAELVSGKSLASDDEVVNCIRRHPCAQYREFREMGEQGFNLVFSSGCIRIASEILGDDVVISPIQHVRAKAPTAIVESATGRPDPDVVPWHRDSYSSDHAPTSLDMLTFWIPLCVVSRENGTLVVAARSHETISAPMPSVGSTDGDVISIAARPGDVVVLHKNVMHGSSRNETDLIRYSLDFRVQTLVATRGMVHVPSILYGTIAASRRPEAIAQWLQQQELVQARAVST